MTRSGEPLSPGVTIGEAAKLVGVTVKTVRHYHRLGLIGEPERDGSGYRRYHSVDLLRLVQVRTLAGAGIPLAQIPALLDAAPEGFEDAMRDIDHRLTTQIDELVEKRATLRRMTSGDHMLLPQRANAVLALFGELGFDSEFITVQKEAFVLARALAPELFEAYLDELEHRLRDPEHVTLLRMSWEAESWGPDDPRLEGLADAMAENLLAQRERLVLPRGLGARDNSVARYAAINQHRAMQWPTSARLTELIEHKLRAAGLPIPEQ